MKLILDGTPKEIVKFLELMDADECNDECNDCECDDCEALSEDEQEKINIVCDVAGAAAGAVANALRKHFD